MTKLVITISLLAGGTAGYSQGIINWSDYQSVSINAPFLPAFSIEVFGPGSFPNPAMETQGTGSYPNNTSADLPVGNAVYTGAPLSGSGDTVALSVGTSPQGVTAEVLYGTPVAY